MNADILSVTVGEIINCDVRPLGRETKKTSSDRPGLTVPVETPVVKKVGQSIP